MLSLSLISLSLSLCLRIFPHPHNASANFSLPILLQLVTLSILFNVFLIVFFFFFITFPKVYYRSTHEKITCCKKCMEKTIINSGPRDLWMVSLSPFQLWEISLKATFSSFNKEFTVHTVSITNPYSVYTVPLQVPVNSIYPFPLLLPLPINISSSTAHFY